MSLTLMLLVLLAALLHASWNAAVKTSGDRWITLMWVNTASGLLAALFIPFVGIPDSQSWIYLFLSVVVHTAYYISLVNAYTYGDLSHVYPLARGVAPILVLIGGIVLAGEVPQRNQLLGVLIVSAGIISLAFEHGMPWKTADRRPLFYALLTGFWIGSYTLIDGMGVRRAGNPLAYIAWLFFLDIWVFAAYVFYMRGASVWIYFRNNMLICLGGGLASAGAYGIVIYALSLGFMAGISALRETSVVIATLIGIYLFKEDNALRRIAAGIIVALGVVIMNL